MFVPKTKDLIPWIQLHQHRRPSSGCKGSSRIFLAYANDDKVGHVIYQTCLILPTLYPQLLSNSCTTHGTDPRQCTLFVGYCLRKRLHDLEDQALQSPSPPHLRPDAWYLMGSPYQRLSSCYGSRPSTEAHFGHRLPSCGVLLT